MDPVTIFGLLISAGQATQACCTITTVIFQFIKATGKAEAHLRHFQAEIENLQSLLKTVCLTVSEVGQSPYLAPGPDQEVWRTTDDAVRECKACLEDLAELIGTAQVNMGHGLGSAVVSTLRFKLKNETLQEYRKRIELFKSNMQLGLSAINM